MLPTTYYSLLTQDRKGVLYFMLTNQIMTAIASLRTFIAERAVIAHEQRAGMYSLAAYFIARSAAESYLQVEHYILPTTHHLPPTTH